MGPCQTQIFDQIGTISTSEKIASNFASALLSKTAASPAKEKGKSDVTLDSIFTTDQQETKLQKARRTLDEVAINLSDEELESHITKFQYLLDCWLDSFEKESFNGKTLDQLLREG